MLKVVDGGKLGTSDVVPVAHEQMPCLRREADLSERGGYAT